MWIDLGLNSQPSGFHRLAHYQLSYIPILKQIYIDSCVTHVMYLVMTLIYVCSIWYILHVLQMYYTYNTVHVLHLYFYELCSFNTMPCSICVGYALVVHLWNMWTTGFLHMYYRCMCYMCNTHKTTHMYYMYLCHHPYIDWCIHDQLCNTWLMGVVFCMCITCVLHVYYMCFACVLHVFYMCITCVLHVY